MDIVVKNRKVGIAPRKVRQVADLIRRKSARDALEILRFNQKQEIALVLSKLIESGLAIAKERGQEDLEGLLLALLLVDQGSTLKRIQPRAKGRAFRIKKRTSHITIGLAPS